MNSSGFKRSVTPLAITVVVFVFLALAGWVAHKWYAERLLREQRAEVRAEVSLVGNALSVAIDRRLNLVSGVATIRQEGASPLVFEQFSEAFAESTPGIGAIALAPGGTITYAYPQQENQQLLGNNLLRHSNAAIRAAAENALDRNGLSLGGPIERPGRSQSLVALQANYRDGEFSELIYFEFALPPILGRAGLGLGSDPFAVVLRDEDGSLIYGDREILSQDPVSYEVALPDGRWELAATPNDGWDAAVGSPLLVFDAFALVIILLTTGIASLVASRQAHLQEAVRQRTREISAVNRQLQEDIVERKRAEAALRESELRLANILDLAGEAIIAMDDAGKIILFNKAAESVFGYQAAQILGQPIDRLIPQRFVETHHNHVQEFASVQAEVHLMSHERPVCGRRKDGSEFPAEASVSRVRREGETTFTVVMRDITARQRMENELREREQQYRSIFESVSDGLFINNLEGRLVDFNPAAAEMHGYTVEEFKQLQPADFIHADSLPLYDEYLEAIGANRTFHGRAMGIHRDGAVFPVEVHGTSFSYRGELHTLTLARDISEQVKARHLLQERVEERTRELSTLLDISHEVASTLDAEQLLPSLFDHIKRIVDYHSLILSVMDGRDEFLWLEHRGPTSDSGNSAPAPWQPGEEDASIVRNLARLREPLIISDLGADTPEAEQWRRNAERRSGSMPDHAGSWMAVPLRAKERPIGILSFLHAEPGYYTERSAQLGMALANQAAVAIENARLFKLEQHRVEQLRSIAEVSHQITGVLAVNELANQAAYLIQQAFGYYHVHIGLIEDEAVLFRAKAGVWREERECHYCDRQRFRVGEVGASGRVAASGEPLLVRDVQQDRRYVPMHDGQSGSALILPLKARGRNIGVLNIESDDVDGFSEIDIGALQPLANQLAVALENARLYEQAQALAALKERQKLARELHDSVSQALYGIGLGTRTALKLVDSDGVKKEALAQPLEYVLSLASAGLAEMRALIFELRPESIEVEGLVPALTRRVEALRARQEFQIEAELGTEPELPVTSKEALYRVAQEALHNVVKHANAGYVTISLSNANGDVVMEIRDDGQGFDPQGSFPGHLGLQSMRERVLSAGGFLTIDSAPEEGTTVRVVVRDAGLALARAVSVRGPSKV